MLALRDIRYRYRRREVLHGVSIEAGTGIYGLLGNNGAGKSTLIKIAATVLPNRAGRVQFGSLRRPGDDQAIRRQLGYLPQEFGLPTHVTCLEYLRYVAAMKLLPAHEAEAEPRKLLERFGLADAAGLRIGALSGGMRQRLGLAQALLGQPQLIILDEPSAGLDPQERVRLRGIIRERASGATILLSTHIVSDIEREAGRVGILHRGELVAEGTPPELVAQARGKVFEVRMDAGEWERVSPDWMRRDRDPSAWPGVVASVNAPEGDAGGVIVRVVSPAEPVASAQLVEPTLEDAYLLATSRPRTMAQLA